MQETSQRGAVWKAVIALWVIGMQTWFHLGLDLVDEGPRHGVVVRQRGRQIVRVPVDLVG